MSEREAWFAVQVETLKEKVIARMLEIKGFECFSPRRWLGPADRRRPPRAYPLFPGYLFCRLDFSDRRSLVVTTPGVVRLVGGRLAPEPIPDHEIEALKKVVAAPVPYEATELERGQRVRIVRGPLRDLEGTLCLIRGQRRVQVEVTLLQRGVSVEVDAGWVVPTGQRQANPQRRSAG